MTSETDKDKAAVAKRYEHTSALVADVTIEQVEEYNLMVIPYFFDSACSERQGLDYFYLGVRK